MTNPKILVTGAAGRTGAPAVRHLLQAGYPVRAFVRRRSAPAIALEEEGAELFVGNLNDFRDLRRAMANVQRAYHCPPFAPHLLSGAMLFALAAEEAGLEAVALMSQWNVTPDHPSLISREHWIANHLYRWMPSVGVVHINPGLFAFTYLLGLPALFHFGMLMAPFGDGRNAPPSNEDVGRVAAAVLMDPAPHIGKSYRPTGPALLAAQDIAEILGHVLGRTVRYRDVPVGLFARAALAQGFPLSEIAHLRHYAAEHRRDAFAVGAPTPHVAVLTGREAEDFETIARRYIATPALIHPALRVGTKAQSVGLLLRTMLTRAVDLDACDRGRGDPILNKPVLASDNEAWRRDADRARLHLLSRSSAAIVPSRQVA